MQSIVRQAMILGIRAALLAARRGVPPFVFLQKLVEMTGTDTDLAKLKAMLNILERTNGSRYNDY